MNAQQSERSARERRAARRGFAAGVLASIALGLACASGGSRPGPVEDAPPPAEEAAAAVEESGTVTATPPSAVPAAPPVEAPAPAAPAPAAPAPAAPADPPTAGAPGTTGESPVAAYLADPKAIGRASQLFRAVCTGYCHSTEPAADRVAPNLFDCEWTHGSTDEAIFEVIAAGIPDTQMQGFGEKLPHEDLWKMVAFMRQKSTCK
jgi:mono/diheme cytochrome c family protein